jgi:hypothetical protein
MLAAERVSPYMVHSRARAAWPTGSASRPAAARSHAKVVEGELATPSHDLIMAEFVE